MSQTKPKTPDHTKEPARAPSTTTSTQLQTGKNFNIKKVTQSSPDIMCTTTKETTNSANNPNSTNHTQSNSKFNFENSTSRNSSSTPTMNNSTKEDLLQSNTNLNQDHNQSEREDNSEQYNTGWTEDEITEMEEINMTKEEYYAYKNMAGIDNYSIQSNGADADDNDIKEDKIQGWHDYEIEDNEIEDLEKDTEEQRV